MMMIIIAQPGTGKTTLAHKSRRYVDVDSYLRLYKHRHGISGWDVVRDEKELIKLAALIHEGSIEYHRDGKHVLLCWSPFLAQELIRLGKGEYLVIGGAVRSHEDFIHEWRKRQKTDMRKNKEFSDDELLRQSEDFHRELHHYFPTLEDVFLLPRGVYLSDAVLD